jgi:hypothetical protein
VEWAQTDIARADPAQAQVLRDESDEVRRRPDPGDVFLDYPH